MSANETLYLRPVRNFESVHPDIHLSDIAKMTCPDQKIINKLKTIRICRFQQGEKRKMVSILKIIELIQEVYPNLTITNEGEAEVIIEYVSKKQTINAWIVIKIVFVSLISFFGTAFTIMAFHNDIGIMDVFGNFYTMITGDYTTGFTELEISYSIGLAVGIILFFNHIGSRRITKDPTPIEVEMRKYETDVNDTLIDTGDREGKIIDVE